MNTFTTGRAAEARAAQYLLAQGFKVIAQNWRTRYCEIDIVAQHQQTVYFVEVKYRRRDLQGSGLDYITPTKLRQMRFAAQLWVAQTRWRGLYCLAVVEVSGVGFVVTNFITEL